MTQEKYTDFYLFLKQYETFYQQFLEKELEKYEVISHNQYHRLDEFIKDEQVFLLKSKGLEKDREDFLETYGCQELTLSQFIETMENGEEKTKFKALYEELSNLLFDLKEANRLSNYLIELRLNHAKDMVSRLESKPQNKSYDVEAKQRDEKSSGGISRKI